MIGGGLNPDRRPVWRTARDRGKLREERYMLGDSICGSGRRVERRAAKEG